MRNFWQFKSHIEIDGGGQDIGFSVEYTNASGGKSVSCAMITWMFNCIILILLLHCYF